MLSRIILAALTLFLVANLALGDRSWSLTSAPRVAEIDTLPDDPALAPVRNYAETSAGTLPYPERRTPPAAEAGPPPLKVGWAYREVGLLGMPLYGYPEPGIVTYFERPDAIHAAILGHEQLALLDRLTGRSYSSLSFPWYRYAWGPLFLLGIFLWTWARTREVRRAEELFFERMAAEEAAI
jgi:hypothetical protein